MYSTGASGVTLPPPDPRPASKQAWGGSEAEPASDSAAPHGLGGDADTSLSEPAIAEALEAGALAAARQEAAQAEEREDMEAVPVDREDADLALALQLSLQGMEGEAVPAPPAPAQAWAD